MNLFGHYGWIKMRYLTRCLVKIILIVNIILLSNRTKHYLIIATEIPSISSRGNLFTPTILPIYNHFYFLNHNRYNNISL